MQHRTLAAIGFAACVLMFASSAPAGTGAGLAPGDLVRAGGVGVFVPPPGQGVALHVVAPGGDGLIQVVHRLGGAIEVTTDAGRAAAGAAGGAGSPCRDDSYAHDEYVEQALEWRLNIGSAPSGVPTIERAVVKGIGAIPSAHNDCGIPDRVDTSARYLGSTDESASINAAGNCEAIGNVSNEVSFGDLPSGIIGLACVRFLLGIPKATVIEADIKLNKTEYRWTTGPGPRCRSKLDVRSVVTHESGHVFGLAHVAESSHPALTMSEVTPYCSVAPRTLGRGDVKGLEALY